MRRLAENFCGNEAFCLVSMDGRARAPAEGPAIELAWGMQATDCLGNKQKCGLLTGVAAGLRLQWTGRGVEDGEREDVEG